MRGLSVGVMKPMETGVGPDGPLDALALQRESDGRDTLAEICPQRFPLPAAPCVAAEHAGRAVELEAIHEAYACIARDRDLVVVEGAGGLLVPTTPGSTMADLAHELSLPLVVVARTALGTINHTLLTLEAAETRGLEVAGVVLCHATGELSEADRRNLGQLRTAIAERIVGEIPALAAGETPALDAIDLPRLLA
jgi:dethiobiotin synthetase